MDMIIKETTISNFRGISNLTLEFEGKSTVLYGKKNAGKTSILDAMDMLTEDIVYAAVTGDKKKHIVMLEEDVKAQERLAEIKAVFNLKMLNQDFEHSYVRERKGIRQEYLSTNAVIFSTMFSRCYIGEEKPGSKEFEFNKNDMPVFAYYKAGRHLGKQKEEEEAENKKQAFDFSSEAGIVLEDCEQWLFSRPEYVALFQIKDLLELSEDEKCVLAMAGDIARKLSIANVDKENPLDGKGIVFIDDIEAGLREEWKEKIVPALVNAFPNIQFLITTGEESVANSAARCARVLEI